MADQPAPQLPLFDNPLAPELFVFVLSGAAFFGGNIHLTFESPKMNHAASPPSVNRVVVGRLVIPLVGAEGLRDFLADYLPKVRAGQTAPQAAPVGASVH